MLFIFPGLAGVLTVDICVQKWKALASWRSFWPSLSRDLWSLYWLGNVSAVSRLSYLFCKIVSTNHDYLYY